MKLTDLDLTKDDIRTLYAALGAAQEDYQAKLENFGDYSEEEIEDIKQFIRDCQVLEKKFARIIFPEITYHGEGL